MGDRPRVSFVSLGVGLAAAGVGAVVGTAVERVAMGRPLIPGRKRAVGDVDEFGIEYGSLRGTDLEAVADDGTRLHVEVDEPDGAHDVPTIVFCHGYSLTLDAWHYQRLALRGRYRLVLWDQRGHGRSERGPRESATIDQVGRDLAAVIEVAAPHGPLILVGHSMGGMTVMSLAAERPHLVQERVIGVAFVATSAGGLADADFGVPGLGKLVQRVGPVTLSTLARAPGLVERGRRLTTDLESVVVRHWSYGGSVSPALLRFTARMIAATDLRVIGDFMPTFGVHDKRQALTGLAHSEVLVLVGDDDLMTPATYSAEIASLLPGAEHVVVHGGGHLVMLEHHEVVTAHLEELITRSRHRAAGPRRRRHHLTWTVTPLSRHRHRDGAA